MNEFTIKKTVKPKTKAGEIDIIAKDKDVIVTYSKAFSEEHKEIRRVRELGLQMKEYNELLGDLSKMFETIAVSGTHGKTTTSTMISHILKDTIGCNYFIGDGSGFASKDNNKFILE